MSSEMPLRFQGDAIVLSGETGTKLKSSILGEYYPFWWRITSGGDRRNHSLGTGIVELNSGTGENYIEETGETILGSAGHALQLKAQDAGGNLKVILVEENPECYGHLKKVIRRKWNTIDVTATENGLTDPHTRVHLLNQNLERAIESIERMRLRNALFFFDPLLYTPWTDLERVASVRINNYYKTGTEFIVFMFTSDWFLGRGALAPLPRVVDPLKWTEDERVTVGCVRNLLGGDGWETSILTSESTLGRMQELVSAYKRRLHKWFRYVLPLPFEPRPNQQYHLFMCSNYEAGVRVTRDFYAHYTGNARYSPNVNSAYSRFKNLHPELQQGLSGNRRPDVWKILWKVVREHEGGVCDALCDDLQEVGGNYNGVVPSLKWLQSKGYLNPIPPMTDAWSFALRNEIYKQYALDWPVCRQRLGVDPPQALSPLSSRIR